jgi:hypothetical protein
MEILNEPFKKAWDYVVGFIELAKYKSESYKYVIDSVELRREADKVHTFIRYKLLGCRTLLQASAQELNNSNIFSLFKPDHAQFIVSIATVEAVLNKGPSEIAEKYERYVNHFGLKIREDKFS